MIAGGTWVAITPTSILVYLRSPYTILWVIGSWLIRWVIAYWLIRWVIASWLIRFMIIGVTTVSTLLVKMINRWYW